MGFTSASTNAIIFLSQHPLGPTFGHKSMLKAVKRRTSIIQYWLNRWNQSTDLNDSDRTGRVRAMTSKQDQQTVSLAEQRTFIKSQDITSED